MVRHKKNIVFFWDLLGDNKKKKKTATKKTKARKTATKKASSKRKAKRKYA